MAKNVVLSVSGGLDSTCLLVSNLVDGCDVHAYSFAYGQKHSIELDKVKENIELLRMVFHHRKITHQIIDLTDVFNESNSSLKVGGDEIPEGHYEDENMKSTVVENRNIIFSSIIYGKALAWANEKGNKTMVDIMLGIHSGDHCIYPDATVESRQAAEHCFKVSNWGSERVNYVAPFENLSKGELLAQTVEKMKAYGLGDECINRILSNTITCYNPDGKGRSCGKCGSCTERLEAFEYAGLKDPVEYQ